MTGQGERIDTEALLYQEVPVCRPVLQPAPDPVDKHERRPPFRSSNDVMDTESVHGNYGTLQSSVHPFIISLS